MSVRLHLTHIPERDRLIALEFGRVNEGQFLDCWRTAGEVAGDDDVRLVAYLHDSRRGPEVGFKVCGLSTLDPGADDLAELWIGPRFDAPTPG